MSKLKPNEIGFTFSHSAQEMLNETAKMLKEPSRLYCDLEWTRNATEYGTPSGVQSWRERVDLFHLFIKNTRSPMRIQSMATVIPSWGVVSLHAVPNRFVIEFEAWLKLTMIWNPRDKDIIACAYVIDPFTANERNQEVREVLREMADHVWWIVGRDYRISEQNDDVKAHLHRVSGNTWNDVKDRI